MTFGEYLGTLGFELVQQSRGGTWRYAFKESSYLQWWVNVHPDGTSDLTWEFELGAYLKDKGFAISVQDELSLMIFPQIDVRGAADTEWVGPAMDSARTHLGSVDLSGGR